MVKWAKDEDEMLRTAVSDGLSIRNIYIPGRSEKSIVTRINRLNLADTRLASRNLAKTSTFAMRKCLPCGKTFGSEHPGNRICTVCKPSLHYYAA